MGGKFPITNFRTILVVSHINVRLFLIAQRMN